MTYGRTLFPFKVVDSLSASSRMPAEPAFVSFVSLCQLEQLVKRANPLEVAGIPGKGGLN